MTFSVIMENSMKIRLERESIVFLKFLRKSKNSPQTK